MLPILILIIFILLTVIILVIVARKIDYDRHKSFVQRQSITLQELNTLNTKYHFFDQTNLNMSYTFDNENFFIQIDCRDYLIYQLQYKQREITQEIKKINQNATNYKKYVADLEKITPIGQYTIPYKKLKIEKLKKIEKDIFNQAIIEPSIDFRLSVTLYCSRINGHIYDRKKQYFNQDEIFQLIKRLNNRNGVFFNDRDIWDSICRVERGKVSNKMRFSIYKRDGYKCCICGISERYARLEIDHIIPIAKGGKSTYNNLQTLCHRCNVEKGVNTPYRRKY